MKYKDYLYLVLFLFLASLNFNLFLKPMNLVCGGTQGLAIIFHSFLPISYSLIILGINLILLLASFLFLSQKMTLGTIISTFLYPIFVNLTSSIVSLPVPIWIAILITGILSGITNGCIYKLGFSTGGIQLLPPIIQKYTKFQLGTIHLAINFLILVLNILFFGIHNFLYSLIVIGINGIIINLIVSKKIKKKENK